MPEINNLIEQNIKIAESLNADKVAAIKELEGKLDNCPNDWIVQTKRFITVIKTNIDAREKIISELKKMHSGENIKLGILIEILEEIDRRDNVAADIYSAVMDESVI